MRAFPTAKQAAFMTSISPAPTSSRLGTNHGYRFDGDFVHLNAEVDFSAADLGAGQAWALQLWASDNGFASGELNGVKVAETAIQPQAGLLATACCHAMPPAGAVDQTLALALVSYAAEAPPQVRDLAVYATCESFYQPRLSGQVSCTLADGAAVIAIDAIANPRAADNLSGTLALEVWALEAPYAGGAWAGSPVASVIVGVLAGGNQWTNCQFSVPAALPAAGAALTVMLREWTPAGYVTRDYRNISAAPLQVEKTAMPAVDVTETAKTKPQPVEKAAAKTPAPAAKPEKPVQEAVKKPARKAALAKPALKAVSVNRASEAELLAVKGLPPSVARAIIAARPFATLDEVCKAKGMGPKMLAKLRDLLVL